jgi:hypothetical protein
MSASVESSGWPVDGFVVVGARPSERRFVMAKSKRFVNVWDAIEKNSPSGCQYESQINPDDGVEELH